MKITQIDIADYQQFKNIKFDFTYPEGHLRAGEPMDKVCFIGQSGTGKTTLLEITSMFLKALSKNFKKGGLSIDFKLDIGFRILFEDIIEKINGESVGKSSSYYKKGKYEQSNSYDFISSENEFGLSDSDLTYSDDYEKQYPKIFQIFLKSNISEFINHALVEIPPKPKLAIATEDQLQKLKDEKWKDYELSKNFVIENGTHQDTIFYLLKDVEEHDNLIREEFSKFIQTTTNFEQYFEFQEKIKDSQPRNKIAEKVNPILKKIFVEIDTNVRVDILLKIIKSNDKVNLPMQGLSTGTKQILSTSLPLIQLDTKGTVILFDEPERSLFPDLQREIIDYYSGLAPEAQFFYATHSPIIASAFEPCERFFLYFDDDGNVQFRNGIAPEGDDPNDILRQDFEISDLMLEKGLEALREYRSLATQIINEKDENKKDELIIKRLAIGNAYNF